MAYAKTDKLVLGYLGRALSLELSAMQQNMAASKLLKLRGFDDEAQQFQQYALHEVPQIERIVGRMLVLGVAPNASQLRPPKLGNSLPGLLSSMYQLEAQIAQFYQRALAHCAQIGDFDNKLFFDKLHHEAQQHAQQLGEQHRQLLNSI